MNKQLTTSDGHIVEFRYPTLDEMIAIEDLRAGNDIEALRYMRRLIVSVDGGDIAVGDLPMDQAQEVFVHIVKCLCAGGNGRPRQRETKKSRRQKK